MFGAVPESKGERVLELEICFLIYTQPNIYLSVLLVVVLSALGLVFVVLGVTL